MRRWGVRAEPIAASTTSSGMANPARLTRLRGLVSSVCGQWLEHTEVEEQCHCRPWIQVVFDLLSCCGGPTDYCLNDALVAVGVVLACLL